MGIVLQHDKRSDITYAYQSEAYWDPQKKQSRSRRTLIGRLDAKTGDIVPTDGRMRKSHQDKTGKPSPAPEASRKFYGATYLLDAIGEELGIAEDLKRCFPETYRQILSTVYYLVLENDTPLYRFEKWGAIHRHPYGKDIPSQRSSELFASITESAKEDFFLSQGRRRCEKEYWVYDITSISSYSEQLRQVQYGHNRENDHLPQLNLALVFGEESNLPFYYRKLAGNIPDVKTLKEQLACFAGLGFSKVKLIMDRGFYSEANVNALFQGRYKFLLSAGTSLRFVRKELDCLYDGIRSLENYSEQYELYMTTVLSQWQYTELRPRNGVSIKEKRRLYIHCYYSLDRAAEAEKKFARKLFALKRELEAGNRNPDHEKQYAKWFAVKKVRGGIKVLIKQDVVAAAKRYYGFFVLISNEAMDAAAALELYRNKDVVEKAFGNLKERLNLRRALVSSEQSLEGKLFVTFVALIYLSHIKKRMEQAGLFKNYTLQSLLDRLDLIECFEGPKQRLRVGEILDTQKELYIQLGYQPPASL
jgi:transposase